MVGVGAGSEESELELRLGPPAVDWKVKRGGGGGGGVGGKEDDKTLLSLGICSTPPGVKRGFVDSGENQGNPTHKLSSSGAIYHSSWTISKAEMKLHQQKKQDGFVAGSAHPPAVADQNQTRTSSAPVVGWPPIRTFRKNLASTSVKPSPATAKPQPKFTEVPESAAHKKGLFVKINMEGVPIGRKVDLHAYDGYEKLACAVDKLFRDLLAAQRDPSSFANYKAPDESLAITGILDGTGEYTLVYEDEEGDRMLAGDDPWEIFVTTVKRLRVLKTSELAMLSRNRRVEKLELACGAA